MKFTSVILCAAVFLTSSVAFSLPRDAQEKNEFRKANPCPTTGEKKGACAGYQVDHKKALMNGGKDKPKNMQWLSEQDHKAKTKRDMATCKGSYLCKHKTAAKRAPWQKSKKSSKKK